MNHPNYRTSCWSLLASAVFVLAGTVTAYCGWQLSQRSHPPLANTLSAEKGYGVTTDLTQYDDAELTDTLDLLHKNGLTWVRQPIPWHEVEAEAGQFDWQPYDRLWAELADHPNPPRLIAVLHTSPAWARVDNNPHETAPPAEVSDFGNFARQFAERYGDQIDHYQIWHEPNLTDGWGKTQPNPRAYTTLLREGAVSIRGVDPTAVILTAALAPTLEDGPLNYHEMGYLDQLYQLHAERWFDVVAAQIYGFATEPEQSADPNVLGFSRVELVRQIMLNHGDADTPIWATAFGWAVQPDDWTGRKSLWKQAIPAVQTQRTTHAILHVRRQWPWLGPMLAIRWDTADLAENDPAFAFALTEHPDVLGAFQTMSTAVHVATVGTYPADHITGRYSPGWRSSPGTGLVDIPRDEPRTLKIAFYGTRFDLTVNRGQYRAFLWVTVNADETDDDPDPANALPTDLDGRSYLVLNDPLHEQTTVTLAENLPRGFHEIELTADGGWGQWAIAGWTVYDEIDLRPYRIGLWVALLITLASSWGVFQLFFATLPGLARSLWAWSEVVISLYAALGPRVHIGLTFGLAIALYLAPEWLAILILPLLGLTILLRPDLGLALIATSLSFFQRPVDLPIKDFSPVEFSLILTVLGLSGRGLIALGRRIYAREEWSDDLSLSQPMPRFRCPRLHLMDGLMIVFVLLGLIATFNASQFGVSIYEWRSVVLESALFYGLVRVGLNYSPVRRMPLATNAQSDVNDDPPAPTFDPHLLINSFIFGAVIQALLALYVYVVHDVAITAEGVSRLVGMAYGSPNNLALFLERVWPILLALVVFGAINRSRLRSPQNLFYLFSLLIISLSVYLTYSRGTLLIALPTALIGMAVLAGVRQARAVSDEPIINQKRLKPLIGGIMIVLTLLGLSLVPLSQTTRFQSLFELTPGSTTYFRVRLWQSSLSMLQDHWLIGVGLDNFLYQYRTRYIIPSAWQEPDLNHPHNIMLDFGTRLGIGGILILIAMQAVFWRTVWRVYRRDKAPLILGLMGSMLTFLAHGLVDNSFFLIDLAFAFCLTVGIVIRLAEAEEDHGIADEKAKIF